MNVPRKAAWHSSLRNRITLTILLPLAVAMLLFIVVESHTLRQKEQARATALAVTTGRSLEAVVRQRLLYSDFAGIRNWLDQVMHQGEFRDAYLVDNSGTIIVGPNPKVTGRLMSYNEPGCNSCHPGEITSRPESIVVTAGTGEQYLRVVYPLRNSAECATCHGSQPANLGLLITDVPLTSLQSSLLSDLRESLFWRFVPLSALLIIIFVGLDKHVVTRLSRLLSAVTTLVPVTSESGSQAGGKDEISRLDQLFVQLSSQLVQHSQQTQVLADRLRQEERQHSELLNRFISVQENERKRIARELHDELGGILTGVMMQLKALRNRFMNDPEKCAEILAASQEHLAQGLDKIYDVIVDLRPSELDDLGLEAAVHNLTERTLAGTGISYEFESHLNGGLAPALEVALFRTYQEALNNVVRHARANQVQLNLAQQNGLLYGEIKDNGQGFDPTELSLNGGQPQGLGLLGMQERIAQCGGQIMIHSETGRGTHIRLRVPTAEVGCD